MIRVIFTILCFEVSILLDNIYRSISIFVSPIEEQFCENLSKFSICITRLDNCGSDITLPGNRADQLFGIAG